MANAEPKTPFRDSTTGRNICLQTVSTSQQKFTDNQQHSASSRIRRHAA
jgi:hypothetical protein